MVLPLYLAMTGREILAAQSAASRCAYMACHFSPYSQGLTNLPTSLPPSSMLILNDRTPICGHDPQRICGELAQMADAFSLAFFFRQRSILLSSASIKFSP